MANLRTISMAVLLSLLASVLGCSSGNHTTGVESSVVASEVPAAPALPAPVGLGPPSCAIGPIPTFVPNQGAIAADTHRTCAIWGGGRIMCWGDFAAVPSPDPNDRFTTIALGLNDFCGVKTDKGIVCVGSSPGIVAPAGDFATVAVGGAHGCGIVLSDEGGINTNAGPVVCWGNDTIGKGSGAAAIPEQNFSAIATGLNHSCGITAEGDAVCWGNNFQGKSTPPKEKFSARSSIAVGGGFSCGIKEDGHVVCWGAGGRRDAPLPTQDRFSTIVAGNAHVCGITVPDEKIRCWGDTSGGKTAAPGNGVFKAISAGFSHSCAIRDDGSVACWGGSNGYCELKNTGAASPHH